jgi:diketogulonate reductase-like aldo/keto reductase
MKMNINSKYKLNNGVEIPVIGLGVFNNPAGETTRNAVGYALKAGYMHIDTAKIYANEEDVGKAIAESGIPCEEIFITTKLWHSDQGYEPTLKACEESLNKLGLDYVDLYLMHWPVENLRLESWKAMEKLLQDGKCRAIGVSNFMARHIKDLLGNCEVVPAVNQIELSPYNFLYRKEVVDLCLGKNIMIEAYSPLTKGRKLNDPKLVELAKQYRKSTAQILIRWALEKGFIVIPKSVKENRIRENADIFDFSITEDDMKYLESFNENLITGWDPTNAP